MRPAERARLHTFIATSDLHLERKLRISRDECLQAVVDNVSLACSYTDDVEFSAEDATRTDLDFLCRIVETAIARGATTINLPDTVGYCTPDEIEQFFTTIIERVPNSDKAVFSTHCHDDLGLAVANSLAAVRGGCRQVECTINGVGERAGNASLEEIVMVTRVRGDRVPYTTNIETTALFPTRSVAVRADPRAGAVEQGDRRPQRICARSGHPSGWGHQGPSHLRDHAPGRRRRRRSTLVLGKHSGRHAVKKRCEQLGVELSRLELDRVYRAMIDLADRQKQVEDSDLSAIIADIRTQRSAGAA